MSVNGGVVSQSLTLVKVQRSYKPMKANLELLREQQSHVFAWKIAYLQMSFMIKVVVYFTMVADKPL